MAVRGTGPYSAASVGALRPPLSPCSAMTLFELLVVLAIVGVLASLTVSGYIAWKRKAAREACLSEVSLHLREARNYALDSAVPSVVFVDTSACTMQCWSFRPVLRVDFESAPSGNVLRTGGEVERRPGRLGMGLALKRGATLSFSNAARFVGPEGFSLRLFLLLARAPPDDGEQYVLVRSGERLSVRVTHQVGLELRVGSWEGRTRGGVIVPGRWQEWELIVRRACGASVVVKLDGIPETVRPSHGKPFSGAAGGPLLSGGLQIGPLEGIVDEVVLCAVFATPVYDVPGEFVFVGPSQTINFSPSGGLDLRWHDTAVCLRLAPAELVDSLPKGRTVARRGQRAVAVPESACLSVYVELSGRIRVEPAGPAPRERPEKKTAGEAKASAGHGAGSRQREVRRG